MASTLQSRMEELEPQPAERGRMAALARAAGVKSPSVRGWFTGKTKELSGSVLLKVANYYGVNEAWLATGKGAKYPTHESFRPSYVGETVTSGQVSGVSHPVTLDPEILHEALTLLVHDESQAGAYLPRARTDRLADLYARIAADGGRLTKDHNADFIREIEARRKGVEQWTG